MKRGAIALLNLSLLFCATVAFSDPIQFSAPFPSPTATVQTSVGFLTEGGNPVAVGYFFSDQHFVSETFQVRGMYSADGIELRIPVYENLLVGSTNLNWAISLNGTEIGTWGWNAATAETVIFTKEFEDVIGMGQYTLSLRVSQSLPLGTGSVALGLGGLLSLFGDTGEAVSPPTPQPVPEPLTAALLAAGIVGLLPFARGNSRSARN